MDLRILGYDHPDVRELVAEVQAYYGVIYGGPDESPTDPADFAAPTGLFVVGYVDGVAAATGGWRVRDDVAVNERLRDGDAELKRMYVRPQFRGRGFARTILAYLERTAAENGSKRLVLETGDMQPEAIALYISCGYAEIPGFGHYRDKPGCTCFAKEL